MDIYCQLTCAYICMALIDGNLHEDEKNYIFDCCKDDYEVDVNFIIEKINKFKKLNKEELEKIFFENLKQIDDKDNKEIIFSHLERLAKNDSYLHPEENDLLERLAELWKVKRKFDFRKGYLDNEQKKIVEREYQSRIIVFSPPGCGKTHVAGNRASYLMKDLKINPSLMMMISFTRTAVKEFRERIDKITDLNIGELKVITLDSFAYEYLSGFGEEKNLEIYLRGNYEENILKFVELIEKKNTEILDSLKEIKHIIIDEAQDITGHRSKLVQSIILSVNKNCGFTIFGDPDQAIYDWTDEETDKTNVQDNFMNTVVKKGEFEKIQLNKNYRMKNNQLTDLSMTLRPSNIKEENPDYFKVFNANKEKLLNNFVNKNKTFLQDIQEVDKNTNNLFLFRRRSEMMRAGEQALKNGFAPALRFGGSQNCIYPWIGSIFYDHTDKLISKSDFTNKWFERCNLPNINSELEPEEAWNKLMNVAPKGKTDVDITLLRKKLSLKPPLDLCLTDYGLSNLIFGTIHASKGREADSVYYYMNPPKEKKTEKNNSNYEEENRVMYVACTRAINKFYAQNIEEKKILSFAQVEEEGNRTYLNVISEEGKRYIRIQVGLKNDFDDISVVSSIMGDYPQEKTLETQKFLMKRNSPFEIDCIPMFDNTHEKYNMFVYEKTDSEVRVSFGALNEKVIGASIQRILRKETGTNQYTLSVLYGIWVNGCRTSVIDENNARLAEIHEPFSKSGFWITPIIFGWGTAIRKPKAWARKYHV